MLEKGATVPCDTPANSQRTANIGVIDDGASVEVRWCGTERVRESLGDDWFASSEVCKRQVTRCNFVIVGIGVHIRRLCPCR